MLQSRLEEKIEPLLRNRQYGFRKNKSASDPIHIVRRVQELYEVSRSPLYMLFIDWKNAFDKLTFPALQTALLRMGVSEPFTQVVMSLYDQPTFQVKEGHKLSTIMPQLSGVRQGCPLSPYLFIIYMNTLMHDLTEELQKQYTHIPGVHASDDTLYDLEFADDIVLLARSRGVAQFLITRIQQIASEAGMQLNTSKTNLVLMNSRYANFEPQLQDQYIHIVNLPFDITTTEILQWFPPSAIDEVDIFPMPPKPGCKTTIIKQATAKWMLDTPQEPHYKSFRYKRKLIKIQPLHTRQVHYGNGRPVPQVKSTTYLGVKINSTGTQKDNLTFRLSACNQLMRDMKHLWNNPAQSLKLKVIVFKTIFHPKLLYGLYHSCLTDSALKQLDAWYAKSLRRVATIPPAFINHYSNLKVYAKTKNKPIIEVWHHRSLKYVRHILRHPKDTISTICYCQEHTERHLYSNLHNRIGKPKAHWLPQVTKLAIAALEVPENLQKLPQQLQIQHYKTKQLRQIATDRQLWRKVLVPTHSFVSYDLLSHLTIQTDNAVQAE